MSTLWMLFVVIGAGSQPTLTAADSLWQPSANREEQPFYLGLQATAPWTSEARQTGVRATVGAVVLRVEPSSPAKRAGLQRGDLIVRYSGYEVESVEDLIAAVALSDRRDPQRLSFVRGSRRYETKFLPDSRSGTPASNWYVHPERGFRLQLTTGWSKQEVDAALVNVTIVWDVLSSAELLYRVDVARKTETAPAADRALDEFVRTRLVRAPGATVVKSEVATAPAVWVAYYLGSQPRIAAYDLAFCHAGRLYTLQMTGPGSGTLDKLPLPLRHVLGTLQLEQLQGPDAAMPGVATAGTPPSASPPASGTFQPPPGWKAVTCENVRLYLPQQWQAVEGTRAGEGMWRLGEGELPKSSFALVRNRPWEDFAPRVESPEHRTETITGMSAEIYEGNLVGSDPPDRLRVIILHPEDPLVDEWTCVIFVQNAEWPRMSDTLGQVLRGISIGATTEGEAHPPTSGGPPP